MKSISKMASLVCYTALLLVGVCGISFADNAAQLDVKISYLYPNTKAVAVVNGDQDADNPIEVVNIYITLLDAAGNPATAGPKGEALNTVVATISSKLANSATGKINGGQFLALANTVKFDAPLGAGPVARGYVDYTDAQLTKAVDTDQIIVSVTNEPNSAVVGQATVVVEAPPADSLVVRTFGDLQKPSQLFEDLSNAGTYGQKNNNNVSQQAGASVRFWVIGKYTCDAVDCDVYTFAPELEGKEVTVRAYADYSANAFFGVDVPGFESSPIAEGTATFTNGIATGTITIKNAGPTPGLDVVLSAVAREDQIDEISSAQMNPAGIDGMVGDPVDFSVDFVTMLSNKATRIALWSDDPAGDPYGNGNLIQPDDCLSVLSTGETQGYGIALVDSDGNAWRNNTGTTLVFESTLSGLNNTGDPDGTDVTEPGGAAVGTTPITITNGAYAGVSVGLAAAPGAPNVGGTGVVSVEGVESNIELAGARTQTKVALNYAVAGVPDVIITNDKTGEDVVAGSMVKLTLIDNDALVDSVAMQPGDNIIIMAIDQVTGQPLKKIGLAGGTFADASSEINTSVSDSDFRMVGYQIPIVIYTATNNNVNFVIEDITRCFTQWGLPPSNIVQILPAAPYDIGITGVAPGVEIEGTLRDDPIGIVNEVYADGSPFNILEGNGVTNELMLIDQYGNTTDPSPDFTCVSTPGLSNPATDPQDENADGIILRIPEYAPIVAQQNMDDIIVCEHEGIVGTQSFEINNIVLSPTGHAATNLLILKEGPQDQTGNQIVPAKRGEAIIRISANGISENDRLIKITIEGGGVLRDMPNGGPLTNPYDTILPFNTIPEDLRLIVSTPGCVTVTVEDKAFISPLASATGEIGPFCACEGNFNCAEDQDQDGSDAFIFKQDFGRSSILRPCITADPCNGDFDCDHDVDGSDASKFKSDFGRGLLRNPCPLCEIGPWCIYP